LGSNRPEPQHLIFDHSAPTKFGFAVLAEYRQFGLSQAFFLGAIRLFQRESRLKDIVATDPEARNQVIRHIFNRGLREVRD
jgi:hypothetical protein